MSFELKVKCDYEDCDAEAVIDSDETAPVLSENLPHSGAIFVLDSGWIEMPEGWTFADSGERCPEHPA